MQTQTAANVPLQLAREYYTTLIHPADSQADIVCVMVETIGLFANSHGETSAKYQIAAELYTMLEDNHSIEQQALALRTWLENHNIV